MKALAIKAVVTGPADAENPDGFYYREEHEWRGLNAEASKRFTDQQKKVQDYITKASSNKDVGPLSAELTGSMDGVALSPINVTGISYDELNKFQDMTDAMNQDWRKFGRAHGQKKDAARKAKKP